MGYPLYSIINSLSPQDKLKELSIHDKKRKPSRKILDKKKHQDRDVKKKLSDRIINS